MRDIGIFLLKGKVEANENYSSYQYTGRGIPRVRVTPGKRVPRQAVP